eukprot:g13883.t1
MAVPRPTPSEWNRAITADGRRSLWRSSMQRFGQMQILRVRMDVITTTAVINACGLGGQSWQLALQLFSHVTAWQIQPNAITCTTLMEVLKTGGEWQACLQLLEQILARDISADVVLFSAAINACAMGSQWQGAAMILHELRQHGLVPDEVMLNAAISACEKSEQWQWALHLLASFSLLALLPTMISFAAAASACEKAAQWQFAVLLLANAWEKAVDVDVILYNAAISACAHDAMWQISLALLRDMEEMKIVPSAVTMSFGHGHGACRLLHGRALKSDVISYNAVIDQCGQDWARALTLCCCLVHSTLRPTVITWTSAAGACAKWQQALCFLEELAQMDVWPRQQVHSLRPVTITYNAVISACGKASRWDWSLRLLADLQNPDTPTADGITGNAAMNACAQGSQWPRALQLFQELHGYKLQPNVITCNSLLAALTRGGAWSQSLELLSTMPTISVTADALSYREVLLTCVQASEWQMALHLQEQMHQQSLQPDVASYSALLMECQQRALEHEIPLLQSLTALSEGGFYLERLLIHKEAELAKERDRCDKAKKKVRQLLAKLSERDQKIMALTLKLEAKSSKRVKDSPSKDAQQRAQIVARLEGLLEQMRQELTSSRLELDELLLRHQVRDEELKTAERSPEALHAQALLGMQVQDKTLGLEHRRCAPRMTAPRAFGAARAWRMAQNSTSAPRATHNRMARAVLLNDLSFEDRDLQVLVATLDACGLIKEWEMTRCRCGGEGFGELFRALARQPLCRLALGYNALGLQGASSLLMASKASRNERLGRSWLLKGPRKSTLLAGARCAGARLERAQWSLCRGLSVLAERKLFAPSTEGNSEGFGLMAWES